MKTRSIFENNFFFIIFAIICTALWGTAFPGVKLGYEWFNIGANDTGSKLMFAGVRFALAGVIVLAVYFIKNRKLPAFTKKEAPTILALSAVQITGNYFFYYLGLSVTAGSIASVLNSFDTFCAVLLVPLFFKSDKLTPKKLIGCVIGLAGIILVNVGADSNFSFSLNGEGFLLISALISTLGIMINKKASMQIDPMIVTGYHLLFGGIILTAIAIAFGGTISFESAKANLCLLYLALVSAVAFLIWSQLLKHNPVSKVSVFKLMTPIFGNVFSALALSENIFDPLHIASVLLVALGIATVNIEMKKRHS
ncbi:MAG: DMT family transporter [Clostridia bacterium]|nr:DMT family transporter [Clostridia bacterium]